MWPKETSIKRRQRRVRVREFFSRLAQAAQADCARNAQASSLAQVLSIFWEQRTASPAAAAGSQQQHHQHQHGFQQGQHPESKQLGHRFREDTGQKARNPAETAPRADPQQAPQQHNFVAPTLRKEGHGEIINSMIQ
jgi:hypothetical protein